MKISIMQPYFLPYLGYFQMISSVDKFVFYDDVNYIKNGWINKNFINHNNTKVSITIPIKNQSSYRKINETLIDWDNKSISKLYRTLDQNYQKKNPVLFNSIIKTLNQKDPTISELNIKLTKLICDYLDIKTTLYKSSEINYSKNSGRTEKIIEICNLKTSTIYINPIGGKQLYDKEDFIKMGINLYFISGTPSSSILDICMNEPKELIINKLKNYNIS